MSENLVAPVRSSHKAWSGSSLAEGIEDLVTAIEGKSWVDGALAGVGLGLDVVGSVLDPFSALLSNGLGWAMEYFEPLREALDSLTGNPDAVASHARTWRNMSQSLRGLSGDLGGKIGAGVPGWTGPASEGYGAMMGKNVDAIGGLSATAAAMASATEGAGGLVQGTRELVRDLIADLVARVVVWAVEAIFVVTIPVVAAQIIAAVTKWAEKIFSYITALVSSLTNLSKLLNG